MVSEGEAEGDDGDREVRRADQAAYAENWRTVLAVDAAVGVAVAVAGVVVMLALWIVVGALVAALGIVYVCLVGRRYAHWRALRAGAGLG